MIGAMNMKEAKRPYKMSKRAEAAAETEKAIFNAAAELWQEYAFADITLDAIAERADVSVRTVIRRYGSKEGVFEAGIKNHSATEHAKRDLATPGKLDELLSYLLEDYENFGDAVVRTLAAEDYLEAARTVLEAGRATHREWCTKMFAPFLPDTKDSQYEELLSKFVVATDIYVWKLLRRDLKNDLETTQAIMRSMLKDMTSQ